MQSKYVDKSWTHSDIVHMINGLKTSDITPHVEVNESVNVIDVPIEPLYMSREFR